MNDERFRILDLGAHDGFVTQFIARKAKQIGRELYVDGIEANLDGVRRFNEKAQEHGIAGHCKHGLVEDAPRLFKEHSYDAVIAYELIEHVVDIEDFLHTIERMVKFNGRIYISTPNGTFGTGNNPHHLRTWTMTDLFDLIRRRGFVADALPGPDGVSVISYKARSFVPPRKDVAIYVGPGWEPWAPSDIETKGLGGSETAAARLTEALSRENCIVTVYGECAPGAAGQAIYKHHTAFDPTERRDLVICSRIPELFSRKINAEAKLLWQHDTDWGERMTPELAEQVDRVMCLSRWHHDHLFGMYPYLRSKLYITRNGIEPSYFLEGEVDRNPHRLVYTSSPDRGLDLLLEMWPRIKEAVPDAEFYYCYASVYDAVAQKDPRIAAFRDYIRGLEKDNEGCINIGAQTQPGVAKLMRSAGVWAAPSWSTPAGTPFYETFCIGALEAAAAGCHTVMSAWGALEERDEAEHLTLIPQLDDYVDKDAFVDAIIGAMKHGKHEPSNEALGMDWQEVAADMLCAAFMPVEA